MNQLTSILSDVSGKLENWWQHGNQKYPCIIASALKEKYHSIPDTNNLEKFWTDVDFVIERTLKIIDNTNYFGQAVPYHYVIIFNHSHKKE